MKHDIPFQISGGLAAKSYGSPRPLNDFDIDIPRDGFEKIMKDVKKYIVLEPARYHDKKWDIFFMRLKYKGQQIDIGDGRSIKIFNDKTGKWIPVITYFSRHEKKYIFGIKVPVLPRKRLLRYKKMLDGEHQRIDVEAIEKSLKKDKSD